MQVEDRAGHRDPRGDLDRISGRRGRRLADGENLLGVAGTLGEGAALAGEEIAEDLDLGGLRVPRQRPPECA